MWEKRENILKKTKLALLGKNIAHSKSQKMYEGILKREISYELIDCKTQEEIPALNKIFDQNLGLSITSPYKEVFLDQCKLEDSVKTLKAINCIRKKDNEFQGTNTDYMACIHILKKKKEIGDIEVFILGDGAMSRVVEAACSELVLNVNVLSRKKNKDFFEMSFLEYPKLEFKFYLIVNTCSRDYVFKNQLPEYFSFWDLNYDFPAHHYLKEKLAAFEDGLELLELQASFALDFWSIK